MTPHHFLCRFSLSLQSLDALILQLCISLSLSASTSSSTSSSTTTTFSVLSLFNIRSKSTATIEVDPAVVEVDHVPFIFTGYYIASDIDAPSNERELVEIFQEILAYYDEFWQDLPEEIQVAYGVLGYNETAWNGGIEPESSGLYWDEVTPEQQEAALFIGYTSEMWDTEVEAIADGVDETSNETEFIEAPITIDLDVSVDPAPSIFTDNDIPSSIDVTSNETEVVETPTTIDPEAGVTLAQGIAAYFDELYGNADGVDETSSETEVVEAPTTIDPEADTLNGIPYGVDVTSEETEVVGAPTTIDPAAEVSAALAPEIVAYYDEYWKDLPLEIQDAYGVLGYNETAWNGGIEPESSGLYWDEITPEQQEAALFIGYTSEMWDTEVDALAYPTASPVPFDATKVVEAGYYDVNSWDELPPEVQDAFATLGYNKDLWDDPLGIGLKASSDGSFWADLTPEQQQAATLVGYDQQSWDAPPTDSDVYDVLDDDTLIYTKYGWWIGRYTTIYFSASFCFVVSGFVDFFREKHFFHIFMGLGGVTGCISAIYMYNSDLLSSIFDATSAHIFLLEAIKMFFEEESLAEDAAKWMKRSLMLADLEFLLGAIIDVFVRPRIDFSNDVLLP